MCSIGRFDMTRREVKMITVVMVVWEGEKYSASFPNARKPFHEDSLPPEASKLSKSRRRKLASTRLRKLRVLQDGRLYHFNHRGD